MGKITKQSILQDLLTFVKSKTFAYILVGIFVLIAFSTCHSRKDAIAEKTKTEQNLVAKNDTLKTYKNKYNELVAEKTIYILTEKELKKENTDLYNKVKQQKGSIITLNNTIVSLKQDNEQLKSKLKSLANTPTQVNDSTWVLPFVLNYQWDNNNYDNYEGQTTVQITSRIDGGVDFVIPKSVLTIENKGTVLTSRESNIEITFGEKVVDNKYVVYIQSAYPGFSVKSLEGFMVDPNKNPYIKKLIKKRHWFNGFAVGVGVTPGYNIVDNKFGFVVGPTLTWNIFNW